MVVNAASPVSVALGERYAMARGVPPGNFARLAIPVADPTLATAAHEATDRARFVTEIRDPLRRFLSDEGRDARARVLVLVKGVPLRVEVPERTSPETHLRDAASASVDAELALLGSGRDGAPGIVGMTNPYFDSDDDFATFRARHPAAALRFVVGRIDGPLAEAEALVDRALAPASPGRWLVDEDPSGGPERRAGNAALLRPAAEALRALRIDVRHDATAAFVAEAAPLAGYVSWGSNDGHAPPAPHYGAIGGRVFPGRFAPRGIALDLVSTNARTLTDPPADRRQSLAGDLLRLGAAGVAGHIAEPALAGVARPDILMRRFAEGVPAGEAFLRSVPYLGWMNLWIGDPLMTAAAPAAPRAAVPGAAPPACDARFDLDGDGVVTTSWGVASPAGALGDLERVARAARPGARHDPACDLDGDGRVDAADLTRAHLCLFLPLRAGRR